MGTQVAAAARELRTPSSPQLPSCDPLMPSFQLAMHVSDPLMPSFQFAMHVSERQGIPHPLMSGGIFLCALEGNIPERAGGDGFERQLSTTIPPSNQFTALWLHSDRLAGGKIKKSEQATPEKCARPIQVVGDTVTNFFWR